MIKKIRPFALFKTVGFAGLLALGAWTGKLAAEHLVLPHSPPPKGFLPLALTLNTPATEETSYAGEDPALLRQFLFALHNGFYQEELVKRGGIVRVRADTKIQTVDSDADMVRVRFLEGELESRALWMKSRPFLERIESLKTSRRPDEQ